jgi:hypothetical protein
MCDSINTPAGMITQPQRPACGLPVCVRVCVTREACAQSVHVRAPQFNTSKSRILKSVNWTKNWESRIKKRIFKSAFTN